MRDVSLEITAADVEFLARRICRLMGEDPDAQVPECVSPSGASIVGGGFGPILGAAWLNYRHQARLAIAGAVAVDAWRAAGGAADA